MALGYVKMTDDDKLVYNSYVTVNFLVSLLKTNWKNIRLYTPRASWASPSVCTKAQLNKPYYYH